MKSLKGRGGAIGKGLSENVTRVWTKTMHKCAEVTGVLEEMSKKHVSESYQETLPVRIERDEKI